MRLPNTNQSISLRDYLSAKVAKALKNLARAQVELADALEQLDRIDNADVHGSGDMPSPVRCAAAVISTGEPCTRNAVPGSVFCRQHAARHETVKRLIMQHEHH